MQQRQDMFNVSTGGRRVAAQQPERAAAADEGSAAVADAGADPGADTAAAPEPGVELLAGDAAAAAARIQMLAVRTLKCRGRRCGSCHAMHVLPMNTIQWGARAAISQGWVAKALLDYCDPSQGTRLLKKSSSSAVSLGGTLFRGACTAAYLHCCAAAG